MSTSPWGGRLRRLEQHLPTSATERLAAELADKALWTRITKGTATRADFETLLASDLEDHRGHVIRMVEARQRNAGPSVHDLMSGVVFNCVVEILGSDPELPLPHDPHQRLVEMASERPPP